MRSCGSCARPSSARWSAAVWVELQKPPEERTWQGKLLGVVPYDFRMPTLERVQQAYWNPRSPKVFTERPVGVGWAVNIPTALRRLGVRHELHQGSLIPEFRSVRRCARIAHAR